MKKFLFVFVLLVLLCCTFLAGSWYSQRGTIPNTHTHTDTNTVPDSDTSSFSAGTVKIPQEKQQAIGVRLGLVEKKTVTHTLRILGRVTPDETRIFKIKAATDGIIKEVYSSTTGSMVEKGEPLASYYSPDIIAAGQSYLIARGNLQVQVSESRLQFLGMSVLEIEELKKTGKIVENIALRAPATGFVLSREVSPELRFQKGEELYRIAKLDRVWILADIFENEARYFRPGVTARVSHPQLGENFPARVSEVLPLFDSATRSLKVRLEVDNPGNVLRLDMFVDVELPITLPPAISVPADAMLDSGIKKTVFVDQGNGLFEPREVETGWRFGNRVEITKGLKPGERIVMSGTFLIDSESRLEMASQGMYGSLSKDPVCGIDVSVNKAEKAGRKSNYKGKTYYFTSQECKQQFDKDPERYVKKP